MAQGQRVSYIGTPCGDIRHGSVEGEVGGFYRVRDDATGAIHHVRKHRVTFR